jgi:hypothetical protein
MYYKMDPEKRQESYFFMNVLFDEYHDERFMQYFYFWKFCGTRWFFTVILFFIPSGLV